MRYEKLKKQNVEKFRKQNKDDWRKRILRIQWGLEIPFSWIQKDLFALAHWVRYNWPMAIIS